MTAKVGEHLQIRPSTQAGIEGRSFDERPNARKVASRMCQRFAKNRSTAFTWSHQSQQQANGGRLPSTIGADKASDGLAGDADREAIYCFALPEVLTQAMGFDRQGAARRVIRRLLRLKWVRRGGHDHLRGRASCMGGMTSIFSSREAFPFSLVSMHVGSRRDRSFPLSPVEPRAPCLQVWLKPSTKLG